MRDAASVNADAMASVAALVLLVLPSELVPNKLESELPDSELILMANTQKCDPVKVPCHPLGQTHE